MIIQIKGFLRSVDNAAILKEENKEEMVFKVQQKRWNPNPKSLNEQNCILVVVPKKSRLSAQSPKH